MPADLRPSSPAALAWDPKRFARLLRRGWWVIVLCALLGGAAADAYYLHSTRENKSSVQVLVKPNIDLLGAPQPVNLDTESVVITSDPVLTMVKKKIGSTMSLADIRKQIMISAAAPNSTVLQVEFHAEGPGSAAQAGAKAVADAYLIQRAAVARNAIDPERLQLQQQIADAQKRFSDLSKRLGALASNDPQRTALQSSLQSTVDEATTLQLRLDTLNRQQINPGEEVDAPTDPKPVGIPVVVLGLGGVLAGMVIGLSLALLLERRVKRRRLRRMVRTPADAAKADDAVTISDEIARDSSDVIAVDIPPGPAPGPVQ